ncbi:MAG: protein kinase [Proteobacteria bacterium]|nr:protein kinase [Pseudomonadota bacterium]
MNSIDTVQVLGTDRYQIRRHIGGGAMGLVYEAWDRKRNSPVALKLLRSYNSDAIYRLKQEFRALSEISHPNLVNLYELVGAEESWFIVMELVQGEDFLAWVRGTPSEKYASEWITAVTDEIPISDPRMSDDYALPAPTLPEDMERLKEGIAQVVRGLTALHEHGKLHRDVKPTNVIVRPDGRVVLVDFGLIWDADREVSELSRIDTVVGTAAFMPPEQARGAQPSTASDLYAVGVMLFQGLTGRLPFEGNMMRILVAKQEEAPPRPSAMVAGVPPDLDQLTARLLAIEPTERPTAREILEILGHGTQGIVDPQRQRFEGREEERQQLEELWAKAKRRNGSLALVHGASGVGKSSFVRNFLTEIRKHEDAIVLRGRCYERETVPYKAFDHLVDGIRRRLSKLDDDTMDRVLPQDMGALSRAFPALSEFGEAETESLDLGDIGDHRNRAFRAFRDLLQNLSRRRPLLISIDDVHWGDLDSARLLTNLLRELRGYRVLWVLTYRSEDADTAPFLLHLRNDPVLREVPYAELVLSELSKIQAVAVARGLLSDPLPDPARAAVWVAEESGGNPFLLAELARHLMHAAETGEDVSQLADLTLDELFRRRLVKLSEDGQRLARVVALTGRPLPLKVVARAAGIESDELGALQELRNSRFVRSTSGPLGEIVEPYHGRISSSISTAMTQDARGKLHVRIARSMEHYGWVDPEALFAHMLNGGQQERAAELAAAAAKASADGLAFDRSAELYRTALSLRDWPWDEKEGLQIELADVLVYAGRGREAARVYLEAAAQAGKLKAIELRRMAGEQLLVSGHVDEGLQLFAEVLKAVNLSLAPSPFRAKLGIFANQLCTKSIGLDVPHRKESKVAELDLQRIDAARFLAMSLSLVDPLQGAYFQAQNLRLALRAGEPVRITWAFALELIMAATDPSPKKQLYASRVQRRARELSSKLGKAHARGLVALGEGIASFVAGTWDAAYRSCRRAERIFSEHCAGAHLELGSARLFAMKALVWRGQLRACYEERALHLAEAEANGNLLISANLRLDVFPLLLLTRGKADQARLEIDRVLAQWQRRDFDYPRMFAMHGQAYLHLYDGRYRDAWDDLARRESEMAESGLIDNPINHVNYTWMRGLAAVAGGNRGDKGLLKEADRHARTLARAPLALGQGHGAVIRAGVLNLNGRKSQAADALLEALSVYDSLEMDLHANCIRNRLGKMLTGNDGMKEQILADRWMEREEVVKPDQITQMLVPGFD